MQRLEAEHTEDETPRGDGPKGEQYWSCESGDDDASESSSDRSSSGATSKADNAHGIAAVPARTSEGVECHSDESDAPTGDHYWTFF